MTIKNSLRNKELVYTVITNLALQLVTAICGFVLPPLIIRTFGSSVNGMVSSITQFIAYLNIVEAGVGGASIAALYKPLAYNDNNERNAILSATRKFYNRSGLLFVILIIILSFVYPFIVGDEVDRKQSALMVLVLGISGASDFFLIGKYRVLLSADKKVYVLSIVQIFALILSTVISVILIKYGFDIVIVKFIASIVFLFRYILIVFYVNKKYKNLNFHEIPDNKAISQSKNVLIHQFGALIVYNLPIILITIFCSLKDASVYMIYAMVFNAVNSLLSVFSTGMNSFFGESLVRNSIFKTRDMYRRFEIVFYMVEAWCYSMTYLLIMPFISIYTVGLNDAQYIQPLLATLFVIEGILNNVRQPGVQLVCGAGHYKQTQNQLIIEVILRFVFSIIFTIRFGLIGVLLGGLISYLYRAVVLVIYPSKNILKKSSISSFLRIAFSSIPAFVTVYIIKRLSNFNGHSYLSWFFYACVYGIILACVIISFIYITRNIPDIVYDKLYRMRIIHAILALPLDTEKENVIKYLKNNSLGVFPYDFPKKYYKRQQECFRDDGFPYVIHKGKRLYGKKTWSDEELIDYYNGLLCEQDKESPHCYLKEGRYPEQGSIIADVGAAEGIFSLDVIDFAKKIYLFECDETWISALEKTFAPYKNKVEIIKKYVSNKTEGNMVKLDDFFADKNIDYIKADIEGAEEDMLEGGDNIFRNKVSKALICVYHKKTSEYDINDFAMNKGFCTELNDGYMFFLSTIDLFGKPLESPYIRHGVMFLVRK